MNNIHQCKCQACSSDDEQIKIYHHQMNVFMSRLNEQQRRWYAGLEAGRRGHGGILEVSKITGLNVETIRYGRRELANDLSDRPLDRVRLPGGGRHRSEKKQPGIEQAICEEVEEQVAGDPMSEKKMDSQQLAKPER